MTIDYLLDFNIWLGFVGEPPKKQQDNFLKQFIAPIRFGKQ